MFVLSSRSAVVLVCKQAVSPGSATCISHLKTTPLTKFIGCKTKAIKLMTAFVNPPKWEQASFCLQILVHCTQQIWFDIRCSLAVLMLTLAGLDSGSAITMLNVFLQGTGGSTTTYDLLHRRHFTHSFLALLKNSHTVDLTGWVTIKKVQFSQEAEKPRLNGK